MSRTGATSFISRHRKENTNEIEEHIYEECSNDVVVPNKTTNKGERIKKTLKQCGFPLILTGVNTALICGIIAGAVYFTSQSEVNSKLIEGTIQKLNEVNSKFEVEIKNINEWKSSNSAAVIERIIQKLDEVNSNVEDESKLTHEWRSTNHSQLIGSIILQLDKVNSLFAFETRKMHEWKSSYLIRCERDFKLYEGHCYYIDHHKKSFDDAERMCASLNGSLAKIEDEAEDHWLKKYLTEDTWVGGKKTDSNFKWLDGTPLYYNGWHNFKPDGSGSCLQYSNTLGRFAWDDDNCYSAKSYACERKALWINVIS